MRADVNGVKGLRGLVFAETKLWLPRLEGREVFRGTEFSACPLLPGDERKMQTGTHRVLGSLLIPHDGVCGSRKGGSHLLSTRGCRWRNGGERRMVLLRVQLVRMTLTVVEGGFRFS